MGHGPPNPAEPNRSGTRVQHQQLSLVKADPPRKGQGVLQTPHGNSLGVSCSVVSNSFDPLDRSLPGSSVHGIVQARTLEWVVISSFRGSSRFRDRTGVSCIAGGFLTVEPAGKPSVFQPKKPRNLALPSEQNGGHHLQRPEVREGGLLSYCQFTDLTRPSLLEKDAEKFLKGLRPAPPPKCK